MAHVHSASSARKQDWALTAAAAPFHFPPPNKQTFPLLVLPKIPSEGVFPEENPLFLVGKACRAPALGRPRGRLCSLLFVLGSLIKGESSWWWLVICHEGEQRDVSEPQTPALPGCRGTPGLAPLPGGCEQCLYPGILSPWMFAGMFGHWREEGGRVAVPELGSSWVSLPIMGWCLCPWHRDALGSSTCLGR